VDGEIAGELPAKVEAVPDALTLLVPPGLEERYRLK
jgi:diacylglycerol kinase family enzyme